MDWLVVLAPLLLLPIVLLFAFVGCDGDEFTVGQWEQRVTLKPQGLPANIHLLVFQCWLEGKSQDKKTVTLDKSNTSDFTTLEAAPVNLPVEMGDMTNGKFRCWAKCTLQREDPSFTNLMDPTADLKPYDFPPGKEWSFYLNPKPIWGQQQEVYVLTTPGEVVS